MADVVRSYRPSSCIEFCACSHSTQRTGVQAAFVHPHGGGRSAHVSTGYTFSGCTAWRARANACASIARHVKSKWMCVGAGKGHTALRPPAFTVRTVHIICRKATGWSVMHCDTRRSQKLKISAHRARASACGTGSTSHASPCTGSRLAHACTHTLPAEHRLWLQPRLRQSFVNPCMRAAP